jgi:dihydroflavonol-4-reductase
MAKTLLTGGTGFLGSHIARALVRRGDELRVLVRSSSSDESLAGIDFERVNGDVTDRRAVRRAVEGVERVFHVAGSTSLRASDAARVFELNVGGTRTVCEEALAAGVERLILTSSVAAIGPAPEGGRADERQMFTAGELGISYVNSKHEAEAEAFRCGAKGLPVVAVNPTFVLGPGGSSRTSMGMLERFLTRRIPAYVNGGINIVDVRDVAAGHLLADAAGEPGERYILGGRNFTLQRLFADLARISGVEVPPVKLPASFAVDGARVAGRLGVSLGVSPDEARSAALWWTYTSAKAKRELGFDPRPHEDTLREAIEWQTAELDGRLDEPGGATRTAMGAAGRALRAVKGITP